MILSTRLVSWLIALVIGTLAWHAYLPLTAVSAAPTPQAAASIPNTPAGRQLAWVLGALDPDAPRLTEADITERFAPAFLGTLRPEQAIAATEQLATAAGPVTFAGTVRPPTEHQVVGLVTTRVGQSLVVLIAVEPAAPHRITALTFQPAPAGVDEAPARGGAYGGLVNIGGRSLYLACMGPAFDAGGPTVILEAGLDSDSTVWLAVQAMLPADVRSCAYDRPNVPGGASDPAQTPRTGADVVAELDALLTAAGVPGPYVLVGHSLGGLFVRLFASEHPEDVAGMVLVDPSHEDQDARLRERVGPELWAERERALAGQADPEGIEVEATDAAVRAARAEAPLPEMPLIVLTHGVPPDPALIPPGWPIADEEALWRELHADLATLVPGGRQIVAEHSGHFIQLDQPSVVVDAIREVLAAA